MCFSPSYENNLPLPSTVVFKCTGRRPDRIQILQRIFRIVDPQVDAFVPMFQQQFTAVFEVAVGDIDERLPEIRQTEKQLLFHAFPVPVGDFVHTALGVELVGEELVLVAELFGEERIDERDVVVDPPRFENLLAAEAQADVPLALGVVVVAFVVILAELAFVPAVFDVFP